MRQPLIIAVSLLLLSGAASSQLSETGYIGLYTDTDAPPDPASACVTGEGFYPVEMWIWCLPSIRGQICAEFMVAYPSNVIRSTVTANYDIIIIPPFGDLANGVSVCYIDCQWDWHWNFHQTIYVTDDAQTSINIVKHPEPLIPCLDFANCDPGYPIECIKAHTQLLINQSCPPEDPIGTRSASWGAIKSLY